MGLVQVLDEDDKGSNFLITEAEITPLKPDR